MEVFSFLSNNLQIVVTASGIYMSTAFVRADSWSNSIKRKRIIINISTNLKYAFDDLKVGVTSFVIK